MSAVPKDKDFHLHSFDEPTLDEKIQFVKQVALFKNVSEEEAFYLNLTTAVTWLQLGEGEKIMEEGKEGEKLFILIKGQVSIQKKTPDGDEFNVIHLSDKNHPALGEGGLIDDEPRSATIRCIGPCQFLVLSRQHFDGFIYAHPKWGIGIYKNIFKSIMSRLAKMNTDLILLHKALTEEIRG